MEEKVGNALLQAQAALHLIKHCIQGSISLTWFITAHPFNPQMSKTNKSKRWYSKIFSDWGKNHRHNEAREKEDICTDLLMTFIIGFELIPVLCLTWNEKNPIRNESEIKN